MGYLFGGGEEGQNPTTKKVETPKKQVEVLSKEPTQKPNAAAPPAEVINKETPAGVPGNTSNNYFRADGQNRGNLLTVCFGSQLSIALLIDSENEQWRSWRIVVPSW